MTSAASSGLHELELHVQPGTPLADLGKASGLTSLYVAVWDAEGFESLSALSGLMGLQELQIQRKGPITPRNLLCLTVLTGLTRLRINPGVFEESEGSVDVEMPPEDLESSQVCSVLWVDCMFLASVFATASTCMQADQPTCSRVCYAWAHIYCYQHQHAVAADHAWLMFLLHWHDAPQSQAANGFIASGTSWAYGSDLQGALGRCHTA